MGYSNSSSVNHRFTSASRYASEPISPSLSDISIGNLINCVFVLLRDLLLRRSSMISNHSSSPSLPSLRAMTNTYRIPFSRVFWSEWCLGERMFDMVTQHRKDDKMTFEDLVIAKATYKKGTDDEIAEFIYQTLDVNGNLSYMKTETANSAVTFTINPLSDGEDDLEETMPAFSPPPPRPRRPETSSWDYFDTSDDFDSFGFVGLSEQTEIDCDAAVIGLEKISQGNVAKSGSVSLQDDGEAGNGEREDPSEFIYQTLDVNGNGVLKRSDLESVLVVLLKSVFSTESSDAESSDYKEMVDSLLNAPTFSKSCDGSEKRNVFLRISEAGAHSFQLSESFSEAC